MSRATESCPHCAGTCEEPGLEVDENGYWLCHVCAGKGWVSTDRARNYQKERERERTEEVRQ